MSPCLKQTCHLERNRHVSLPEADMSPCLKQTCLLHRNRHVSFG